LPTDLSVKADLLTAAADRFQVERLGGQCGRVVANLSRAQLMAGLIESKDRPEDRPAPRNALIYPFEKDKIK